MKRGLCAVVSLLLLTGCSGGSSTHPASSTSRPTSGGNLPVQGALPAPANKYFSGPECNTAQVTLTRKGELDIRELKPTTNWTVEYDGTTGQMLGSLHSGAVTTSKSSIVDDYPDSLAGVKYAQITLSGKTTGSCVVIMETN